HEHEVADQPAVGAHRLRPHPRAGGDQVSCADLGHQTLKPAGEPLSPERQRQFARNESWVPGQESPEPKVPYHLRRIAQADISAPVSLSRERDHGIGARVHHAAYMACQVQAEKRKPRIGNGIDQVAHQVTTVRTQGVVLTPEWDDSKVEASSRHPRDSISLQTSTIYQDLRRELALGGGEMPSCALPAEPVQLGAGEQLPPQDPDFAHQGVADSGVVYDAFLGHPQRGNSSGMRLVVRDLGPVEPSQSLETVPCPALLQGA